MNNSYCLGSQRERENISGKWIISEDSKTTKPIFRNRNSATANATVILWRNFSVGPKRRWPAAPSYAMWHATSFILAYALACFSGVPPGSLQEIPGWSVQWAPSETQLEAVEYIQIEDHQNIEKSAPQFISKALLPHFGHLRVFLEYPRAPKGVGGLSTPS